MINSLVLLQADSLAMSSNVPPSSDILPNIEFVLVVGIIVLQLFLSFQVYIKILKFGKIFDRPLNIINGYVEKSDFKTNRQNLEDYLIFNDNEDEDDSYMLKSDKSVMVLPYIASRSSDNNITQRIIQVLNSYLINNYGAIVNFSIIKDILEREVDLEDSEINNAISTPLYLGLAATMLGVIFGLFGMPDFASNNTSLIGGVAPLINGVKMAMFASLSGLLFTTVLSSFIYKHARTKVNQEMNAQISYFQNKLLPVLIKAEDTGVSGLKSSLDRFGRETTKILEDLHGAIDKTRQTLSAQLQVITKVENLNFTKVSKVNLELFDHLESNMGALQSFSQYLNLMEKVSSNLSSFSERTTDFKKIADAVNSNLNDSKQLTQFLTSHLNAIQVAGTNGLNAFNLVDSKFTQAIEKLSIEVENRIIKLNDQSNSLDTNLLQTFSTIGEELKKVSALHIQDLTRTYLDSLPEFKNLEQLKSLPIVMETMNKQLVALDKLNSNIEILISNSHEKKLSNKRKDEEVLSPVVIVEDVDNDIRSNKPWYKFWA